MVYSPDSLFGLRRMRRFNDGLALLPAFAAALGFDRAGQGIERGQDVRVFRSFSILRSSPALSSYTFSNCS
jgi:hypothetical protein